MCVCVRRYLRLASSYDIVSQIARIHAHTTQAGGFRCSFYAQSCDRNCVRANVEFMCVLEAGRDVRFGERRGGGVLIELRK